MEEIKISVVVPVYNMKKLMSRAVDSLLGQRYDHYEIILVDDGSTDGSAEICDAYAEKYERIHVIHKENGGLSTARNAGIDAAKGDYIIFPDPDDWVEPDYLQSLNELKQQSGVPLVICGHYVDTDTASRKHNAQGKAVQLSQKEALKRLVKSQFYCGFAWNKLLELRRIRQNGLRFDQTHGMGQDLVFMVKYFLLVDKICYDPQKAVYHYYQSPAGVTNASLSARKLSGLKTYEDLAIFCRQNAPEIYRDVRATQANLALTLSHSYVESKCDNEEWKKQIRRGIKNNLGAMLASNRGISRKGLALLSLVSFRLSYRTKCLLKGGRKGEQK